MCYHIKFGRFVSKSERINEGNSKIGERSGPASCSGRADPLEICFSPHVKFGRFVSKNVRRKLEGNSKIGERSGFAPCSGGGLTHWKYALSHMYYPAKLSRSRSNSASIMEIPVK